MAVFQSKYRELSFNVGEEVHRFNDGKYATDDTKVIAVLEKMRNVSRIDESEKKAEVKEAPAKVEEKPKAAPKRKANAKPSAK